MTPGIFNFEMNNPISTGGQMEDHQNPLLNRRSFLKLGLAGATVTALGTISELSATTVPGASQANPVYRTLGRTGLKISVVSFGAMLTPESEVIRASLDYGVNYIDTARVYLKGKNEEVVAKAIKGFRPKLFLATKTKGTTKAEIFKDIETSLKSLETDYVDVYQLHNLTSKDKDRAFDPQVREALLELKKQGKIRFCGITTHTDQAAVVNAMADDPEKFFDTVLVGYNFKSGPELKQAIAKAAKAGIGVIAMKTQAGGYQTDALGPISPHQAALKWVLQDSNVTAAIPGMKDMSMLKEDLSVMGMPMTLADRRTLDIYGKSIESRYCHLCTQCEGTCPNGVAISVINRSLMYAEAYKAPELAKETYMDIPLQARLTQCGSCSECVARCVRGINISDKMAQARQIFC
jgi:uncharacterized protein